MPSLTFIPNLGSDPCQQGPWKARALLCGQRLTRAFPLQRWEEPVHHSQRGVWSWQDGVSQVCHALLHHGQWLGQWHQHRREGPGVQSHHGGKAVQMSLASLAGVPSAGGKTAEHPASCGQHSYLFPRTHCPLLREIFHRCAWNHRFGNLLTWKPRSPVLDRGSSSCLPCPLTLPDSVMTVLPCLPPSLLCPVPSCHPMSANQCPTKSFPRGEAPLNQESSSHGVRRPG